MKLLDTTHRLFPRDEAIATAAELAAGDPEWTYTAVHDPKGTGYSYIAVYDEDGVFVERI